MHQPSACSRGYGLAVWAEILSIWLNPMMHLEHWLSLEKFILGQPHAWILRLQWNCWKSWNGGRPPLFSKRTALHRDSRSNWEGPGLLQHSRWQGPMHSTSFTKPLAPLCFLKAYWAKTSRMVQTSTHDLLRAISFELQWPCEPL